MQKIYKPQKIGFFIILILTIIFLLAYKHKEYIRENTNKTFLQYVINQEETDAEKDISSSQYKEN